MTLNFGIFVEEINKRTKKKYTKYILKTSTRDTHDGRLKNISVKTLLKDENNQYGIMKIFISEILPFTKNCLLLI